MRLRRWFILAMATAASLAISPRCAAAQYLIRPGEDWQWLGSKLRPGDEIILMPGEHKPASFDRVIGSAQRPITIRGVNADNAPTIITETEGIRVDHGSHLVIKNLKITGAKMNGINIAGAPSFDPNDDRAASRGILIQNVSLQRVGPRGLRHGILLRNLAGVRIERCSITGWGGSAIELITCRDVRISNNAFNGLEDHSQMHGVRARALSRDVEIDECRFENAGDIAICIGGVTRMDDINPTLLNAAPQATLLEATNVHVYRTAISESAVAVAFMNAGESSVRNTTVTRPRAAAFAFTAPQTDERFHAGRHNVLGRNLITWDAGASFKPIELEEKVAAESLQLDANLWWCESATEREKLASLPGRQLLPQVVDVNPRLNGSAKAQDAKAAEFGHD